MNINVGERMATRKGFYKPTKKQLRDKAAADRRINFAIGTFVTAWSRLELKLRVLELIRTDGPGYEFSLVDNLDAFDFPGNARFGDKIRKILPSGNLRQEILELNKIRNLIVHGYMIGMNDEPVIVHMDFVASMAVQKGFPYVRKASMKVHRGSLPPDTVVSTNAIKELTKTVNRLEKVLSEVVDAIHDAPAGRAVVNEN